MSVWFDVKASIPHTSDDGYPTLLKNALSRYTAYEQRLFREESRYVLDLCDMHGINMLPRDECEQKTMERFAEEEAARRQA